jgi:hypothetical protein
MQIVKEKVLADFIFVYWNVLNNRWRSPSAPLSVRLSSLQECFARD